MELDDVLSMPDGYGLFYGVRRVLDCQFAGFLNGMAQHEITQYA
jgi:hypothetical protein